MAAFYDYFNEQKYADAVKNVSVYHIYIYIYFYIRGVTGHTIHGSIRF